MNSLRPGLIAVVSLRSAGLALTLSGQTQAASVLMNLATLVAAGQAVDAHMQRVADLLESRALTGPDWDAAGTAIQADFDALMAIDPKSHPAG